MPGCTALMQVVHFDTPIAREEFSWVRGTNRFLPARHRRPMGPARARRLPFARQRHRAPLRLCRAASRRCGRASRPAAWAGCSARSTASAMREAAALLLGQHDFTFVPRERLPGEVAGQDHASASTIAPPRRYWRFEFEADAFLHHMIRNIMGCLLAIGQGTAADRWMSAGAGGARPRRRGAHLLARRPVFPGAGLRPRVEPARPHGCV